MAAALFLIVEPWRFTSSNRCSTGTAGTCRGASSYQHFWTWHGAPGLVLATPYYGWSCGRHVDRLEFLEVLLAMSPHSSPSQLFINAAVRDPVDD